MAPERNSSPGLRVLAVLLALLLWYVLARVWDNPLLLPDPLQVGAVLLRLLTKGSFWLSVGHSALGIGGGFLLALLLSTLLAALSAGSEVAEALLRPYVTAARAVPVAGITVIALLWLGSKGLSLFISFLAAFPLLYTALLQGIRASDRALLEMAESFRLSFWKKLRYIYLPGLKPYLLSGCRSALGLCWKAGVAAELIGVAGNSIGGRLYTAKVSLEMAELFAWTAVTVALSALFEQLFLLLLRRGLERLEGVGT